MRLCSPAAAVSGPWETTTLLQQENIPGPGPRKRQLPGSWCCSLHCNLSSLYLGSKNLHLDGKIRRDICIGMMVPPTQGSSGLGLKALLHKSTCIDLFCKAIPFLHWTHLAVTPWSVQKCKAFPQWVLTEKVLLSPRLKGAVISQRDIIHEDYEWCCILILHLTCLTDLLKLVFPGVMDTVLYSCPPLWDRKELCYFSIKPSSRRSKTINCFETYFWKGIKWKEFPNLSRMEH